MNRHPTDRPPAPTGTARALALALAALACAAARLSAAPAPPDTAASALAAERAGRTNAAIRAYERLLADDLALEPVAAPRLAALYAGLGDAPNALAWAARVARRHPQPQAYLAAVHAQLGQLTEAALLLRTAAAQAGAAEPSRLPPLLWQLADVQERGGETAAALETLARARDAAPDPTSRDASLRRLDALRARLAHAAVTPPARQPPAEGQP